MLAVIACLSIAYDLGKRLKQEAIVSAIIATVAFLLIQINVPDQRFEMENLGSKGLFTASSWRSLPFASRSSSPITIA